MSTFLYELGGRCYRARKRVIALWLALLAVIGVSAALFGGKYNDEFTIPGAPGVVALEKLSMTFPQAAATQATALVTVPEGTTVDAQRSVIEAGLADFDALDFVDTATSPWTEFATGLVNEDKSAAMINIILKTDAVQIPASERDALVAAGQQLQATLPAGSEVDLGGQAFNVNIPSLSVTEGLGLIVAGIVLVVTLGSALAAGLPLITAVIGVGITMALITVAANIIGVNSTTPMLAVMLGLAVGIDYALFILSRHRDQLRDGMDVEESVKRSVATAGSAVIFAGSTVVLALLGLGLAGIPFLTSMGAFAAVGVALAVVIALTMLPAFMGLLGERMRPRRGTKKAVPAEGAEGKKRFNIFRWWVGVVVKWPIVILVAGIAVAGLLSVPAKDLQLSLPNSGQNPAGQPDRVTFDKIASEFGPGYNAPIILTADIINTTDPLGVLDTLKKDVEAMPGVQGVVMAVPNPNADTGMVQIVPDGGPTDRATEDLVTALRAKAPEWRDSPGVDTAVTGYTVVQIDVSSRLGQALLPFSIFVVGLSLVLLTMVFRSIWVPIKATLGYLLSVGVAFGATQLVFNRGIARQLVNMEKADPVLSFLPIIVMGILFGLAMDYEVFLVSRMREEYVHGKSPRDAIVDGYVASGKVVVAAAVIMFSVFAFFVPEGMGVIKQIAFALAIGVLVDAFLVRLTMVPAVLSLLGKHAWTLPRWLDRHLPSFDVEGEALTRLKLTDSWPTPDHTEALHAEDLVVDGVGHPVDLHLEPGEIGAISGRPSTRGALVMALAGRYRIVSGKARVAGHMLGDEAGKVRSATRFVDADISPDAAPVLERALADPPRLTVVNNADHLDPAGFDALVRLVDATRLDARGALVIGVTDPQAVERFCPDGVCHLELAEALR